MKIDHKNQAVGKAAVMFRAINAARRSGPGVRDQREAETWVAAQ
jgi:hypothetical protein